MMGDDTRRVAELHMAGHSHAAIQLATGFGYTKVVRAVVIARKAGMVPPRKIKASPRQRVKYLFANRKIKLGFMSDILLGLTPDQLDWLAVEAGKIGCASVAEYITEMVRDAHAEGAANGNDAGS